MKAARAQLRASHPRHAQWRSTLAAGRGGGKGAPRRWASTAAWRGRPPRTGAWDPSNGRCPTHGCRRTWSAPQTSARAVRAVISASDGGRGGGAHARRVVEEEVGGNLALPVRILSKAEGRTPARLRGGSGSVRTTSARGANWSRTPPRLGNTPTTWFQPDCKTLGQYWQLWRPTLPRRRRRPWPWPSRRGSERRRCLTPWVPSRRCVPASILPRRTIPSYSTSKKRVSATVSFPTVTLTW